MRSKRLWAGFLALLVVFCCLLGGCLSAEDEAVLAPSALPQNLDPQLAEGEEAAFVIRHLFEGLTVLTPEGIALGAAESVETSSDGLTYRFTLREDASWSDGEPVEAEDFVFAFQRLFDPSTGSEAAEDYLMIAGASERLAGQEVSLGVEAEGNTVVFTLDQPEEEFLYRLSLPAASPCREDFFQSTHGRYGLSRETILGNGRYTLSTWDGEFLRLRGRGADEGEVIRMQPEAEQNVYWQQTEEGELDLVYGILFNQSVDLFSSELVRTALASNLPEGLERPGTALSPGLREGQGTVTLPEINRDQTLYRQGAAGKETDGLTVLIPEEGNLYQVFSDIAQIWQRDFGLFLAVETLPEEELMERVESGEYDCAVVTLPADYPSPRRALQKAGELAHIEDEDFLRLLSYQEDSTAAEEYLLQTGGFIPIAALSFTLQTGGFPAYPVVNREVSFFGG